MSVSTGLFAEGMPEPVKVADGWRIAIELAPEGSKRRRRVITQPTLRELDAKVAAFLAETNATK